MIIDSKEKTDMMRTLDAIILARSLDGREVFLFGHCRATEEMTDYLLSKGIRPSAILDNSASKQGLTCKGTPIVPPETVQSYSAENSTVLIAARFYADMAAQLRHYGYDGEIIQVTECDSFTEYSLTNEAIKRREMRMLRGTRTLWRIRETYPADYLIICPNNALGDVYWAMAFFPAYCEKHRISKTAAVVTGSGCRQVAEMFGMANTLVLDNTEMDEFLQALIYTHEENCIIAHHDRPYTDMIIKYLDKRFLSFINFYRIAVFGLPKETVAEVPSCLQECSATSRLVEGKTVIISPCAKSIVQMPRLFWERLAWEWRSNGFLVCTCVSGKEKPVKGTVPISVPLCQMASTVEYAGCFIGLRSGLCDIIHTARCRKILVFPDCHYSTTPYKVVDFFALPGWEIWVVNSENMQIESIRDMKPIQTREVKQK